MKKILPLTCLVVLMAVALAGCGRKGAPEAPPGSTYPAVYPNQ